MKKTQYVLAIDLGTSGPKVALVTTRGEIVAHTFGNIATHLVPGGAEQDTADWWLAIKTCVHHLLAQNPVPVTDIIAIGCTAQWSGTVAVDRLGHPLMNAIIWMDARGEPYVRALIGGGITIAGFRPDKLLTWARLTGGAPTQSGKDSIAHILYLKHRHPDIYDQTYKFLEPKDYVNLKLTGQFAATYDSITLHWLTDNRDLSRVRYHNRLLKMAGIPQEKLPDLVQAVDVVGPLLPAVARELGLSESTLVVGGTPDIHSAAVGSGAVLDYEAHLYLGTSSWLTCHVPFKKIDVIHSMASLPSALPNRYLLINEQEAAGACLDYLIDYLLYPNDDLGAMPRPVDAYERINQTADTIQAGSDGLIFLPWLNGERSPVDDPNVRGGFFNQSFRTTRAHMVRAVLEGVAFNNRWLLHYVEQFIKRPLPGIRIIGGGAQSDMWCQIMADVLDRPIHQMENPLQANTLGAALLASLALGHLEVEEIGQIVKARRTFTPNPAHRSLYDEQFSAFTAIYNKNRSIYKKLNLQRE